MKPICIYHGGCADGFTAAWAVWKALGPDLDYVPRSYGEDPPDVTGRDVIMVDFSFKRPIIAAMAATCQTMVILDHHKTAAADLAGFPLPVGLGPTGPAPADWGVVDVISGYSPYVMADHARACNAPAVHAIFDMDRSGAQIAWDFFHPGAPRPRLIDYVADRDLWRFWMPASRAVSACLHSYEHTFAMWDDLAGLIEDRQGLSTVIAQGEAIDRQHLKNVTSVIRATRRYMTIGGYLVPVCNCPNHMASDAAGKMAEGQAFAASYYDTKDGRNFSLRSRDGGVDVSEIAKRYGGGGHRNAAGFQAIAGWEGEP